MECFWAQWQLGLPHLRKRAVKKPGRKSSIWAKRAVISARLSRSAFKVVVMGASCLTGIIACQKRKENPAQTLSDFDHDSYVVHPVHTPDLHSHRSLSKMVR